MTSTVNSFIRSTALVALLLISGVVNASADVHVEYSASVTAQASSESLAPYMLGSWNQGRYVEGSGIWQEAEVNKPLDLSKRFSWSAGAGYLAGVGSKTAYDRWDASTETWGHSDARRNAFRITQLFAQIKFRAVYMTLGMKNSHSLIVDENLSSGDLTRSCNASPMPGIGGGFVDFQNIPLTKGWLQIDGELMYGKMTDKGFKEREFNYYQGYEGVNLLYNYKRCYFRTNPEKNFHVTVGLQAAAVFGGTTYTYWNGKMIAVANRGFHVKEALQMIFPMEGGESYYTGNHVGSWDFKGVYKLRDESKISAYFQWLWEDGSGIGKMNGWDGLWGLQYDFGKKGFVSKAVVEYLDFTNQSGPMHFDPEDLTNNPLIGHAQGADNYYNNDFYGAYAYYGMSIGTPFLMSPIYNRNGSIAYLHNRARGFHAAIEGDPTDRLWYRMMVSHQVAGGAGRLPDYRKIRSTSTMLEGRLKLEGGMRGFEIGLRMAFDAGKLRGDNFGAQFQIAYKGDFIIKRKGK